ncbi:uncharacterized protein LOC114337798 isoform X1 [Diabrotica virgifera virgifera]|uniref:Connector enhancer of kinase suppressor of ras 2 n=1 Tax=Diabrotica virgifera virgifera TaxID=50390 RepID=A0ABM5JVQ1_DIAVI|nr:uncharacterized protein LOC114337798 isoform X1 [Diabrotica virgifera virgifera]
MAYVNVKDWSVDQVTDWLKGLDSVILQYNSSFLNNGVTGHQLLNLRADDLEHLGVKMLGHQEIILEAVEHLRNFHFELDKENLQTLALRLSCAANSLYKELLLIDDNCTELHTQVMSDVHNIITTIKPLAYWLDRSPFAGDKDYIDNKTNLLQLGFEMATSAHRGIFSEKPVCTIRKNCEKLAKIADHIIQEIVDPMILQPASLDLATLKKKEQELGFFILPNYQSIHQIAEIKHGSPAHGSSKIEEGDEIVQVNYQTVVGWQRKKVMMLLQESPPEIVLTLKKRPRHTKVYGQIYMKPYRLPSRKRNGQNWSTRWNENIPSPRLLPIINLPPITISKSEDEAEVADAETELSSSDSEPPDSPLDSSCRMYPLKPRPILQRRNTISGGTPTNKRAHPSIEQYWDFIKSRTNNSHSSTYNIDSSKFEEDSKFLRDKSASCNVGLDLTPRPTTVIGLAHTNSSAHRKNPAKSHKKKVNFQEEKKVDDKKEKKQEEELDKKQKDEKLLGPSNLDTEKSISVASLASLNNENISYIDEVLDIKKVKPFKFYVSGRELTDRTSMTLDYWKKEIVDEIIDTIKNKTIVEEKPRIVPIQEEMTKEELFVILEKDENTRIESSDIKSNNDKNENKSTSAVIKDPILSEINIHSIIKKFDEQKLNTPKKPLIVPRTQIKKSPEVPPKPEGKVKPAVPPRSATTKLRGKLDKSHSTPAYDLSEEPEVPPMNPLEKPKEVTKEIIREIKIVKEVKEIRETKEVIREVVKIESIPLAESVNQLGIPVVEMSNLPVVFKDDVVNGDDLSNEVKVTEVPPKPPPRNVTDMPKPAYPADSPKPQNLLNLSKTPNELHQSKPVFEFPEPPPPSNYGHIEVKNIVEEKVPPKHFEPRMMSTPTGKGRMDYESDAAYYKATPPNYEIQKSASETKVSPTNSIVKGLMSGKKAGKKKSSLTAKRRKVTVNDLSPADIQGYLFQRLRGKHNQNVHWEKRWFVLLGSCLYGFKAKEDPKAACLIFLSGFTVALASEVKSRSHSFKVYHTGTVFYFSAEDPDTLQSWIDLIKTATLVNDNQKNQESSLYSETDESDTERLKIPVEKSDSLKKFGSLKKFTSKKSSSDASPSGSTSLDRKWFFNKSSSHRKDSVPVPTAQFRSYRKIRTNDSQSSVTTGNFTSHVQLFGSQNLANPQNVSVPNLSMESIRPELCRELPKCRPKPVNYMHASNPSLCNVSSDYTSPNYNKSQFKMASESLAGFVTLEQLMIRQTEERKMNPHHIFEEVNRNMLLAKPDVVYGEVPIRPRNYEEQSDISSTSSKTRTSSSSEKNNSSSSCFGKRLGSLKKNHNKVDDDFENKISTYPKITKACDQKVNRSLPRTHKIQDKYCRYDDLPPQYSYDKELSAKFKERSYEMIYCPETVNDVQFAMNRALDDTMYNDAPKKGSKIKKQHSFSSTDKKTKFSNKVQDSSSTKVKLKSAIQYTPMSLPSSQDPKSKPKFAFELNLDEKSQRGGKIKNIFGGKSEGKKEKTFLGSPKLHRAIFKKHSSGSDISWPSGSSSQHLSMSQSSYSLETTPPVISQSFEFATSPNADYPGLEYPPVFEPETYSLANPQTSLNLLKRQEKNTQK